MGEPLVARYQLLVQRDGRCVLTTSEPIDLETVQQIEEAFEAWRTADPPKLAVIPEGEVIAVTSIELHLEAVAAAEAGS